MLPCHHPATSLQHHLPAAELLPCTTHALCDQRTPYSPAPSSAPRCSTGPRHSCPSRTCNRRTHCLVFRSGTGPEGHGDAGKRWRVRWFSSIDLQGCTRMKGGDTVHTAAQSHGHKLIPGGCPTARQSKPRSPTIVWPSSCQRLLRVPALVVPPVSNGGRQGMRWLSKKKEQNV